MSQPQMDILVALPPPALRPRPVMEATAWTAALQRIRTLSHYRPDYAYRPDRYEYTETDTTDPHYVVWGVKMMMAATHNHGEILVHMGQALQILTRSQASAVRVSVDVMIRGIPAAFFHSERHTSNLRPDLAVWPGPKPVQDISSYRYIQDGVPLLVVEVVSHSSQEMRDNDWRHKMSAYAHMGIREYWIVDTERRPPLCGYTLDAADGTPGRLSQYRLIEADAEGGMDSRMLAASLRWAQGGLQCWYAPLAAWVPVGDLPVKQAEMLAERQGELKTWGRILHRLLDAAVPGAADQVLHRWSEHPPDTWPSDETLDRLHSAPEQWCHLLLGEPSPHAGNG